ncbi:hypothetical protein BD311DRAFT_467210 [Dichomitus squalens]|nr:hypothetical protein BD311DRAFT_467210 [Dichomitus squalens]
MRNPYRHCLEGFLGRSNAIGCSPGSRTMPLRPGGAFEGCIDRRIYRVSSRLDARVTKRHDVGWPVQQVYAGSESRPRADCSRIWGNAGAT